MNDIDYSKLSPNQLKTEADNGDIMAMAHYAQKSFTGKDYASSLQYWKKSVHKILLSIGLQKLENNSLDDAKKIFLQMLNLGFEDAEENLKIVIQKELLLKLRKEKEELNQEIEKLTKDETELKNKISQLNLDQLKKLSKTNPKIKDLESKINQSLNSLQENFEEKTPIQNTEINEVKKEEKTIKDKNLTTHENENPPPKKPVSNKEEPNILDRFNEAIKNVKKTKTNKLKGRELFPGLYEAESLRRDLVGIEEGNPKTALQKLRKISTNEKTPCLKFS